MNNNFEKFKKLAFLPIDIPYEKLDLNELEVFHDRNYLWPPDVVTKGYGNKPEHLKETVEIERHPHDYWRIVPLLGQMDMPDAAYLQGELDLARANVSRIFDSVFTTT